MILFYIFLFIFSCALILWMGKIVVDALINVAYFLKWREFVVAFFAMAFASAIPNFFVDISSAFRGIPQLAFGDVVGGNVVDLTIAIGLAALISGCIKTDSRVVQSSLIFTFIIAILPLLLIWDGKLGRADGLVLISFFFIYIYWLFSKKERFTKIYEEKKVKKNFKFFVKDLIKLVVGICFLLFAAQGIIKSSTAFSDIFNLPLPMVGILIVGFGNALPEIYFSLICSKREDKNWLILGDIMGAVIIPATLILGIVALISPIETSDFSFSSFAVARFFMIASAVLFFFFVKTGRKITRNEGLILISLYIIFLLVEIIIK